MRGLQKLEGLRAEGLQMHRQEIWTSSKDARVELVVVCAQSYVTTAHSARIE